ncbi:hypothetical protein D9758_016963 [Tetrapyrgos nigripes]|uniref:CCHC-type domain-containing protein n=1 Tax=Tetrapyrgos nigripes TaxID=182062 RepID=A0A8H5FD21_9AGAR|nr:hypothetical protein D9758_016963 [Tetrapyrgos nigripes]
MTERRSASADPNLRCANRPHVFHPASNQDACYIPENGDDPWVSCKTQPCLNRYNTQRLTDVELPNWLHVITQLQELAIQKAHRKPRTRSGQGTSTPPTNLPKPNPVPETPSNNPPEPNDPTSPPSSPIIPSAEGPSVAPRRPPTPPSPDPQTRTTQSWLTRLLSGQTELLNEEENRIPSTENVARQNDGGDWATQRLTERDADEENEELKATPDQRRWITLKEIRDRFKRDFKPLASEDVARTKIKFAKMRGTDISGYNSIFDTYGEESEFGEAALLEFYQDGLPPKLREAVGRTYPKWKDFDEYQERAVELHLEWLKERERQGRWKTTSTSKSSSGPSQGRTVASVNALMGSGANSSFNLPPKLTPDERDRLRKAGACFACRQTGHMSNECPTFPRTSSQNTSRTFPPRTIRTTETASPSTGDGGTSIFFSKHDQGNL